MKKSIVVSTVLLVTVITGVTSIGFLLNSNTQKLSQQPTEIAPLPTNNQIIAPQPTVVCIPITPTATIIPKPSIINVISPTNKTYSTNTIELTYTVNSKVLWSYYLLDPSEQGSNPGEYTGINKLFTLNGLVPFKGNITLNLPEGTHRIVFAIQTEESRFSNVPIAYQTNDFIIATTG
jgi:hypothetical protein